MPEMSHQSTCVFCHPPDKEIVDQDDNWLIMRNIAPRAPVSLMVIPRMHITSVLDVPPALWVSLTQAAQTYIQTHPAEFSGGYRLVINYGPDSRQSQPHLHMHILAGADLGGYCTSAGYLTTAVPSEEQNLRISLHS